MTTRVVTEEGGVRSETPEEETPTVRSKRRRTREMVETGLRLCRVFVRWVPS